MFVSATIGFEIEVPIHATFIRGAPARGPSYDCGGEAAEPNGFEDIEIEDFLAVKSRFFAGKLRYETVSLLKGIDLKSPEAKLVLGQFFQNILEFYGQEDTEDALRKEAYA